MKIVFYLLMFLTLSHTSLGQITITEVSERSEANEPIPIYDSLERIITIKNYKQYIGQQIYILPKSKLYSGNHELQMKGYTDFSVLPIASGNSKERIYKPIEYEHKYSFISDYKTLAGKYFKIIDIINHTDRGKFGGAELGLFLKLQSQENKDVLYYQLVRVAEHLTENRDWPFVFVGYIEKFKRLYKNKVFISQITTEELTDIKTGQQLKCNKGSEWKCTDLTLIEIKGSPDMIPVFILKDSVSNQIAVGGAKYEGLTVTIHDFKWIGDIIAEKQQQDLEEKKRNEEQKLILNEEKKFTEEQSNQIKKNSTANAEAKKQRKERLIKKYGGNYGSEISNGKVLIGMTKEMCIEAWGKPASINKTIVKSGVHEQWVYNLKSYLYFENDILTTIQN